MEELTLVYFTVDEEGFGRMKGRGKWQYRVEHRKPAAKRRDGRAACGVGEIITVHFPARERPGRFRWFSGGGPGTAWRKDAVAEYLSGLPVPAESGRTYYLYEDKARSLLGRREEPLPFLWILGLLAERNIKPQNLVLLQERELEVEELVRHFVADTRYIAVVSPRPGEWEPLAKELEEECGFLLDTAQHAGELHLPGTGQVVVIGGRECAECARLLRARQTVWIETDTAGKSGRRACGMIRECEYLTAGELLKIK